MYGDRDKQKRPPTRNKIFTQNKLNEKNKTENGKYVSSSINERRKHINSQIHFLTKQIFELKLKLTGQTHISTNRKVK